MSARLSVCCAFLGLVVLFSAAIIGWPLVSWLGAFVAGAGFVGMTKIAIGR